MRKATAKDFAATSFEPLSAAELQALQPPSKDVWNAQLAGYRVALSVLKKSKDELKGVVQKDAVEDILSAIKDPAEFLGAIVDVLRTAETRLVSAAAASIDENYAALHG